MNTNNKTPVLICVDWGSSNFRAFLLNNEGTVLDRVMSDQGMLTLEKEEFESVLEEKIRPWLALSSTYGFELPVIMAGMVGSKQGWFEVPYCPCPANINNLVENLFWVPNSLGARIAIIPGVNGKAISGQADVMRGEEVQVFGALALLKKEIPELESELSQNKAVLCLPGTHSKWVRVGRNEQQPPSILEFATQMTGELFSVLDQHSLLGKMQPSAEQRVEFDIGSFDQALVSVEGKGGLLHQLFSARANVLAGSLDVIGVQSYLSGLLIGSEVKEMLYTLPDTQTVYLIGGNVLNMRYQHALNKMGINVVLVMGELASYHGVLAIAKSAGIIPEQRPLPQKA